MEAFKPAAGTVLTFGYDDLGQVGGVSVDVRELRSGAVVRGLLVEVTESQYRKESSFVDADEIPELVKGFDAILDVKGNPTAFKSFEVRYTTKGDLQLTAFNGTRPGMSYAVQAGRLLHARVFLDEANMRKVRAMLDAAQQKLEGLPAKH